MVKNSPRAKHSEVLVAGLGGVPDEYQYGHMVQAVIGDWYDSHHFIGLGPAPTTLRLQYQE
jgi:hypothetical protein